ncbi:MAG: glutamate 5-kinase [Bacillota bacterium]|nr:glutamate 5-kinase [Bacillota bacterium]
MRIVIKIGSSTLTHKSGKLNIRRVEQLCKIISDIKNEGHEIIMVSSGAIAMGVGKMNLSKKPDDVESKQALAAVGQCELMYVYDKLFSEYNHCVAQILVTGADLEDEVRRTNFQHTLYKLLEMNALPIINENDTIATSEIAVGDNDTLGAIVATNIQADLLILLSDIDGLYTADPHKDPNARLIHEVRVLDEEILSLAGGAGSELGTGGMQTKLNAAKLCMEHNCDMIIANGEKPENLYKIIEKEVVGTYFHAKKY